ncbi:extracellular solute-binding protein [Paenibacillus sp. 1001270B_150601_E10]|uniref:extracellular solute-binding protein n=1 Tax=Paenibacillus sp. 1001270B_150601_E10 TaxID=2787079 RepID=UPI00189CC263
MKRKVGLTLLAVLLCVSMFGCSSSGTSSSNNGKDKGLRMLMPYSRFDPNKDFMAGFIQEKTGVQVNYEMLPAENFDEKLNLLVANKEPIDIMKLSSGQFYQLASSGALEPLNDLIDQHGNQIKAAIQDTTWGSATIDGKIYAIPEAGSGASAGEALVVRQDWMDELGLKTPTNPEELYNVLKTIKDKKQIVPLTGAKDSIYGDIASAFGIVNDWTDQNGKLVHKAEQPEMKEFLTYMNRLYSEGLIDQEMPINTAAKAIEKFTSGKAAMYKLAWWNSTNTVNSIKQNFPDAKLSVIPYLKNKDGKANVGINTGITWFIAIPKASKHKEEAMKLLNAKLEPETFKGLAIGQEGVHHEVKDGKYYPILPKFNDDLTNGSSFMTGTIEKSYPDYWQARVRKEPILQSYFEAFQKEAEGLFIIDPMSLAPPIESVNKNKLKLTKLLDDNVLKYITGAEPIANYDQFLKQWHDEGGADMVKQANDWYTNK